MKLWNKKAALNKMGFQNKEHVFLMLISTWIGIILAMCWYFHMADYPIRAYKAFHGVSDQTEGMKDHFRNVSQPDDGSDVLTIAIFRRRCSKQYNWLPNACFASCPRCRLIEDMNKSDAVFFTIHSIWPQCGFELPRRSSYSQKWIMVSRESPRIQINPKYWDQFNATASLRSRSDIVLSFGKLEKRQRPVMRPYTDHNLSTKKNVAWMVSNCEDTWGRRTYADELAKHIDVTIFGRCGTHTCKHAKSCMTYLNTSYRFYLAFENSLCKDYVTEKLFRTLKSRMIPIVYGLVNYTSILPQKSFIDVRDFNSPRHLANYLRTLAANKTLFDAYFKWKERYELTSYDYMSHHMDMACRACDYLHRTRYDAPKTVDLATLTSRDINCVPKETFLPSVGVPV